MVPMSCRKVMELVQKVPILLIPIVVYRKRIHLQRRFSKKQSKNFDDDIRKRKSTGKFKSAAVLMGGTELSLHEQSFMPGDLLKTFG